jgi:hypothetical protein
VIGRLAGVEASLDGSRSGTSPGYAHESKGSTAPCSAGPEAGAGGNVPRLRRASLLGLYLCRRIEVRTVTFGGGCVCMSEASQRPIAQTRTART